MNDEEMFGKLISAKTVLIMLSSTLDNMSMKVPELFHWQIENSFMVTDTVIEMLDEVIHTLEVRTGYADE